VNLAITRQKKQELIEQYKELLQGSSGFIMTSFEGLTVKDMEDLRSKIRDFDGSFRVVKNNLVERVFDELEMQMPGGTLTGTTAMGFTREEVVGVVKAIVDLAKEVETVKLKGAIIEGVQYDHEQITQMAELPPMPVVQARLLGLIQTPAQQITVSVASAVRQILNVMSAYAEESAPASS
jgi:large subunit ribosomal protein L10